MTRIYTISHSKYDAHHPYAIHLGTDLLYSTIDFASTYEMAVTLAKAYAGENGKVFYTEGLFQPRTEI